MTAEQFTYWLKGFVELNPAAMPTQTQWQIMKDHLNTVFVKVTPNYHVGGPTIGIRSTDLRPGDLTTITC